jgi:hypothetical protein
MSQQDSNGARPADLGMYFVMALVAACSLVMAARGDLWLDEIWSLELARSAGSAWDVFTRIHHDNNHPLNTLYLYWLSGQHSSTAYRMLSVLSGIGAVLLAGRIARTQWGRAEAWLSMALLTICYPLLLYFSEARGYAEAIFLSLLAYSAWRDCARTDRLASRFVFWIASMLGILAHGTFAIAAIAFVFGDMLERLLAQDRPRDAIVAILRLHGLPLGFAAAWYLYFLRGMNIGGGDSSEPWSVTGQAAALLMGLPDSPVFRACAVIALLGFLAFTVRLLRHEGDRRWPFLLAIAILAPAIFLFVTRAHYIYFRYFLITFSFVLIFAARAACETWRHGGREFRALAALALLVFATGQIQRDLGLLRLGRGQYSATLSYILDHSDGDRVLVGSDHDFRNPLVIRFHASRLPGGGRLVYVDQSQLARVRPEWFLMHNQDLHYQPVQEFVLRGVGGYRLEKVFPFSGISGWDWFLYRRVAAD